MSEPLQDVLNMLVTQAIVRAERLADEASPTAAEAYAEVSKCEEALVAFHPADDLEGAFARVGAVTAALRAGQVARARELARRYVADPALAAARRQEIDEAFSSLAPGGFGAPDPLARSRRMVRKSFLEKEAA